MHLYLHDIRVRVATPECSCDALERKIEEALSTRETAVVADTDRDNRRHCPSVTVPDPPIWVSGTNEAEYFSAYDVWRDEFFPTGDKLRDLV